MKVFVFLLVMFVSVISTAEEGASCKSQAVDAALGNFDEDAQGNLIAQEAQFLGTLEIPDMLDGSTSDFYGSYFVVLGSDSETLGVSVITKADCSVHKVLTIGSN